MKERIFTLKKGTEVAAQFDGVTIPFLVPEGLAEMLRVGGGSEEAVQALGKFEASLSTLDLAARNNVCAVFNQAHALNVQKDVKPETLVAGATVESLRAIPSSFKYGQVRVRGVSTGATKPTAAKVEQALGVDFLATLTPAQRAMYDARLAGLKAAPKVAPVVPAAAPAVAPAIPAGKKK